MKVRLGRGRKPSGGRLESPGHDHDRGHREYVARLEQGNQVWLRTKPFSAPPDYELALCLRTFAHIVDQLGLGVRAQVLDVGCGPGWLSEFLARCGYWVTGIDISEDMIRIARERIEALGPIADGLEAQAEFHAMNVHELRWENRFDAAVLYDTMHHFDDEIGTLRTLLRGLAPGGRIYIHEGVRPAPGSEGERQLLAEMEQYGTLESPFDPGYLRWCLEEAGFADVRQFLAVDELVPLREPSSPVRLLARWAWIRAGRGVPDTNTLVATKPLAGGGAGSFGARVLPGDPIRTTAGVRFAVRLENSGPAYWPAPGGHEVTTGMVTLGPYVLEGDARRELPRVLLPRGVAAGDAVEVVVEVPAAALAGAEEVLLDLVRERIEWFSPPASPLARVRVPAE